MIEVPKSQSSRESYTSSAPEPEDVSGHACHRARRRRLPEFASCEPPTNGREATARRPLRLVLGREAVAEGVAGFRHCGWRAAARVPPGAGKAWEELRWEVAIPELPAPAGRRRHLQFAGVCAGDSASASL
ncbi:unnamed protein product [Rangifer tarandus platyrhynchus]|uniref:Uncharacterized protein n=1 Tax=Rangifer tarandus platyrhynchus TaxID=3082113 RepID=A0AC60A8G5_RANTA